MPGYGRCFSPSRHNPRGHSRTKRGWFCLVPSKLDPRSALDSTTAGLGVAPGDQPQPSTVIPDISRRWTRPTRVWIQCASAHCQHNAHQRCWRSGVGLCWRPRRPVSNVNSAQQCPKEESASSITVLQAQPIIVAPLHPSASHQHNARSGHWAREAKPRRQHSAAPTVRHIRHCPKGESASPITVRQAQPTLVASRHPDTSQRHNARGGHWAHKGRLRRCQHEAAPTVCRTHRGPNKETAAHKTGFALHTLQLRAQATDIVRSQPLTLCRHRAQSHSRTKKASYARCSPGRFPGQAGLNYPYPGLATTTVGPRRPWLTNVAPRQRTTPETGDFALPQRGARTLCSPVRTLHSLVIPKPWPGTPQRNAAVARRRPRPATAFPTISTTVVTPSQHCTRQAVDSISPRPQPCLPPGAATVVPPRRSAVLCPVSRTGNCCTVPVIRGSPETLTKAPRRATCRVISAVCAVPRVRHGARMALAERWKPIPARSTTVRLTPSYAVEVA